MGRKQTMFRAMLPNGGGSGGGGIQDAIVTNQGSQDDIFVSNFYPHVASGTIITSTEAGSAKTITGIQVRCTGSQSQSWTFDDLTIRMAHTSDSVFTDVTQANYDVGNGFTNQPINGVTTSNEIEVLSNATNITIPPNTTDWIDINFTTNFSYNGSSNLVVWCQEEDNGGGASYAEAIIWQYQTNNSAGKHAYWQYVAYDGPDEIDTTFPSFSGREMGVFDERPNMRLIYS